MFSAVLDSQDIVVFCEFGHVFTYCIYHFFFYVSTVLLIIILKGIY